MTWSQQTGCALSGFVRSWRFYIVHSVFPISCSHLYNLFLKSPLLFKMTTFMPIFKDLPTVASQKKDIAHIARMSARLTLMLADGRQILSTFMRANTISPRMSSSRRRPDRRGPRPAPATDRSVTRLGRERPKRRTWGP